MKSMNSAKNFNEVANVLATRLSNQMHFCRDQQLSDKQCHYDVTL